MATTCWSWGRSCSPPTRCRPRGTLTIGRAENAEVRLDDPLASRQHARLHIGDVLQIEDLGSANKTRVRDVPLSPGERLTIAPGEAIAIGSTILMVQQRLPPRVRLVRPHGYLEARLEEECARSEMTRDPFALVRLHVEGELPPARLDRADLAGAAPARSAGVLRPERVRDPAGQHDARRQAEEMTRELWTALRSVGVNMPHRHRQLPARRPHARGAGRRRRRSACAAPRPTTPRPAIRSPTTPSCSGSTCWPTAPRRGRSTSSSSARMASARRSWPSASTADRRAPTSRSCASTARRSRSSCSRASCSATSAAPSRAPTRPSPGCSRPRPAARSFSTRSARCRRRCRSRLLRVLETRLVTRVGGLKARPIDVRFVAATNRNLEDEVAAGRFRRDLYFRLNGMTLHIPPLRARARRDPAAGGDLPAPVLAAATAAAARRSTTRRNGC